jgi:hypothetical protein
MDAGKSVYALKVSQSISSLRDYQWSPKSLDTTKLKGPSEESLLKRRKVSFPDLGIYPITAMTTVHEDIMDSRKSSLLYTKRILQLHRDLTFL